MTKRYAHYGKEKGKVRGRRRKGKGMGKGGKSGKGKRKPYKPCGECSLHSDTFCPASKTIDAQDKDQGK
eukprot:4366340-Prorocentrum_lima.AAC.1